MCCISFNALLTLLFHISQVVFALVVIFIVVTQGYYQDQCLLWGEFGLDKAFIGFNGACDYVTFSLAGCAVLAIIPLVMNSQSILEGRPRQKGVRKTMRVLTPMVSFILFLCGMMMSLGLNATCVKAFAYQCVTGFQEINKSFTTLQSTMILIWVLWGQWSGYCIYEYRSYNQKMLLQRAKEVARQPMEEDLELSPVPEESVKAPNAFNRSTAVDQVVKSHKVEAVPDLIDMTPVPTTDYTQNWTSFSSQPVGLARQESNSSNPFANPKKQMRL